MERGRRREKTHKRKRKKERMRETKNARARESARARERASARKSESESETGGVIPMEPGEMKKNSAVAKKSEKKRGRATME